MWRWMDNNNVSDLKCVFIGVLWYARTCFCLFAQASTQPRAKYLLCNYNMTTPFSFPKSCPKWKSRRQNSIWFESCVFVFMLIVLICFSQKYIIYHRSQMINTHSPEVKENTFASLLAVSWVSSMCKLANQPTATQTVASYTLTQYVWQFGSIEEKK